MSSLAFYQKSEESFKATTMQKETQEQQVINALEKEGGLATLRRLNEIVDFSAWQTKTPEASVRRIVQNSKEIFKVQPGLWALECQKESILNKLNLKIGDKRSEELFSHSYYQGLIAEIGKLKANKTFIPAQDRNKPFLGMSLGDIADITTIPQFTYENLLRKARTVDVIWFNVREMPSDFYEIEHTTDIKNSLSKFYELQDFHSRFFIVANSCRRHEFLDKLSLSVFHSIKDRVHFLDYEQVAATHAGLSSLKTTDW